MSGDGGPSLNLRRAQLSSPPTPCPTRGAALDQLIFALARTAL
jgi:hypothetical protein